MKLCVATNNQNKLTEIQSLIGDQFTLVTLEDIGCNTDIPEPYATIAENSKGKAEFVWNKFNINCIADDTGLEVYALHGQPGVLSARYAGTQRNPDDNMDLLLSRLDTEVDRSARFVTIITLVMDGVFHQFEGVVEGTIIFEKRGSEGFGYDPVFLPKGYDETFAEMTLSEKNTLSHRGRAISKLVGFLKENC